MAMTSHFKSAAMDARLKRAVLYKKLNTFLFVVELAFALGAAALSTRDEVLFGNLWPLYVVVLTLACAGGAGFIAFNVFAVVFNLKKIGRLVAEGIAETLPSCEGLLGDGGEVELFVDYEGDDLTVTRKNTFSEIRINSLHGAGALKERGLAVKFDLSELKSVPTVYSSVGTKIWQFLSAHYGVNCGKFERVTVTDSTGKETEAYTLVDGGKAVQRLDKNYYIKHGIVKP